MWELLVHGPLGGTLRGIQPDGERTPDPAKTSLGAGFREEPTIRCAACGHRVTHASERIAVRGEHAHVCVNPAGVPFYIGCFRRAPGCVGHGPEESYWSWFDGYRWRIALCGGCLRHLGWSFHGNGSGFHALVIHRLVEQSGPPESTPPE